MDKEMVYSHMSVLRMKDVSSHESLACLKDDNIELNVLRMFKQIP